MFFFLFRRNIPEQEYLPKHLEGWYLTLACRRMPNLHPNIEHRNLREYFLQIRKRPLSKKDAAKLKNSGLSNIEIRQLLEKLKPRKESTNSGTDLEPTGGIVDEHELKDSGLSNIESTSSGTLVEQFKPISRKESDSEPKSGIMYEDNQTTSPVLAPITPKEMQLVEEAIPFFRKQELYEWFENHEKRDILFRYCAELPFGSDMFPRVVMRKILAPCLRKLYLHGK